MSHAYLYPNARIAIFAKAPIAGQTKTRMQPELTPEQSANLQENLIWHSCNTASNSHICATELWCTPDIYHATFTDIKKRYDINLYQQTGDDLGERIWHGLQDKLEQTSVILGTDCPYLTDIHLRQLIEAIELEHNDISIIPAHDGGYVALACKQINQCLFNNIHWGSELVYQQTVNIATQNQWKIKAFEPLSDIDRYEDYQQMCKNLPNLCI